MKKFAFAAVFGLAVVSFALAEDINALIYKVDTAKNTIEYAKKGKKGEEPGPKTTVPVSASVKVLNGKFDADTKKMTDGDPITDGLKNADKFGTIPDTGVAATITIADDGADKGKVTKVLVGGAKGGKKKGKA